MIEGLKAAFRLPFRAAYWAAYRWSLPMRYWFADRGRDPLLPPARLRFRVTETLDPVTYRATGESAGANLRKIFSEAGHPLDECESILDFGCGCGRTLTFLQAGAAHLCGVDVDSESVEWCNEHIPGVHCQTGSADPPLNYPAGSFDAIYAVSVFTHLDLARQRAWRDELFRLLRSGGLLLFTVHAEDVRQGRVGAGGFTFQTSRKLKGILPEWYHTTFQSHDSVTAVFGERFADVTCIPRGMGAQDVYLAWRRHSLPIPTA